jgi:outer membrane immunogenic protein
VQRQRNARRAVYRARVPWPRAARRAARTLYYVTAGPAFGHSTFRLNFGGAAPGTSTFTSDDRLGWTVGGGIEQALTEKWSIVGEYKYIDLGSQTNQAGHKVKR